MERTIGVFGEELLLWTCLLRQSPRRPPPDHVHRQANILLDELKQSKLAQELPVVSVDDGMFAIACLLDEVAMMLPDLRPYWSQAPLQATRWNTNNGGVEFFDQRLMRARAGPKSILATYVAVLGMGFQGRFGLPGADRYALAQLRRELSLAVGVDPDRDWNGGALKPLRADVGPSALVPQEPVWKRIVFGRAIALTVLVAGLVVLALVIYGNLA